MLRLLLFCAILMLTAACGRESDIAPTLASEAVGQYRTNGFMDVSCIALQSDKMPSATLQEESQSAVTLTYLEPYPSRREVTLPQVRLSRSSDNSIQLIYQTSVIGTLRTDRAFGNNGLERQAVVLRIVRRGKASVEDITFTGTK